MSPFNLDEFISKALEEDIGDGDHTSLACIPETATGKARLIVKENGILAGVELAKSILKKTDETIVFDELIKDGTQVRTGDIAFTIKGKAQPILKAERLVLNCMQRMSGIATYTNELVRKLDGLKTKLLDTRKTTPGFRYMEKWAVKIGGGENHRFGLFDMIMIKDNHIDYAGGIKQAIKCTRFYLHHHGKHLKVEIEARNLPEVEEILSVGGVDRIMLDNFTIEDLKKAVKLIDGRYETEASGGITGETIRSYAETGVDYISVGALTHRFKSLDLSLKAFK